MNNKKLAEQAINYWTMVATGKPVEWKFFYEDGSTFSTWQSDIHPTFAHKENITFEFRFVQKTNYTLTELYAALDEIFAIFDNSRKEDFFGTELDVARDLFANKLLDKFGYVL